MDRGGDPPRRRHHRRRPDRPRPAARRLRRRARRAGVRADLPRQPGPDRRPVVPVPRHPDRRSRHLRPDDARPSVERAFVVIRGEETSADVIAEALSRSWIDRPAVAVRAELRPKRSSRHDDGRRSGPDRPLGKQELLQLLERHAALERTIAGAQAAEDIARHRMVSLTRERTALIRSIDEYEARLANARRTVTELDRPLSRRRHRVQLDAASNELQWIPRSLRQDKEKLAEVGRAERASAQRLLKAKATEKERPQLLAEQATVRSQLDHDARLRGEQLAATPSRELLQRFGTPPPGEAGRVWVEAVGRVAQHRTAFDQQGRDLLGRSPALLHDDVYATSYWATREVVERADRVLGRELAIEPPHRSLGLSR